MNIGQLWVTLGVDASGLKMGADGLKQFESQAKSSMDSVGAALERTSNQFQRFGSAASRYLTVPLTLIGGGALKMASDFEYASQKVVALAGVAQSQMDAWKVGIARISNMTARSSKELADALYYVASSGIRGKEALDVVEYSAKAAASGLGETDVIARLVGYALNNYGKANITAARATDILVASVREGKVAAETLASAFGMVLPVASAMGVPFEQIGGALAAMTRTGFNASMAATSLRQILASMLKPTHQARKALAAMSLKMGDASYNVERLRKTLREDGLLGALMKVHIMTERFGEDIVAKVFPNVRALTGVLSLMGKNLENNIGIQNRVTNSIGAMNDAFAVMSLTTEQQLKLVKISFQNNLLAIGAAMQAPLIPILKSLGNTLNNLAQWFRNLSPSVQESILKFGLFLAALGPVALAIAAGIKLYAGFRVAILFATGAFQTMTAAMMANPWMAAAVGVALLATYFIQAAQAANQLSVAQRTLNELNTIAQQSVIQESVRLESLLRLAKSEYATKEMKARVIAEINGILPTYLGGIDEEAIKTGRATVAISEYISKLKEKAALQAASDLLVDTEKKYLSDVMSGANKKMTFGQSVNSQGIMRALGVSPFGAYFDDLKSIDYYQTVNANNAEIQHSKTTTFLKNYIDSTKLRIKGEEALGHVLKNNAEITTPESYLPEEEKDRIRMKELMELAQTASGKRLDQLMKEWVTLDKIKRIQDDLIKQAIEVAQNNKINSLGPNTVYKSLLAMGKSLDTGKTTGLKGIGNDPFAGSDDTVLGKRKGGIADVIKYTQEYARALQDVSDKKAYLGGQYNAELGSIEANIAYYEAELKYRRDNVLAIDDNITKLKELYAMKKKVEDADDSAGKSIIKFGHLMKQGIQNAALAFGDLIGSLASGDLGFTNFFDGLLSIVFDFTSQLGKALIGAGIAAIAFDELLINPFAAVAAGIALVALSAIAKKAFVPDPAKMAQGGVVPSGYKNDTYPALLSSGEAVIPAGASFSMPSNSQAERTVKFRIEGRELVGILQSMGKLQQSY